MSKKRAKSRSKTAHKPAKRAAAGRADAKTQAKAKEPAGSDGASAEAKAKAADAQKSDSAPPQENQAPESPTGALEGYSAETLRDMYLRALADNENLARRAAGEVKKARDFALDKFAPSICEVRDCLETALGQCKDGDTLKGIELTLRKLAEAMEANGIRPVRPDIGATFDAVLHQAVGKGEGDNTISQVMQCGYTLNGRLIRAAMVWVGSPPATPAKDAAKDAPQSGDGS